MIAHNPGGPLVGPFDRDIVCLLDAVAMVGAAANAVALRLRRLIAVGVAAADQRPVELVGRVQRDHRSGRYGGPGEDTRTVAATAVDDVGLATAVAIGTAFVLAFARRLA